MKEKKLMILTEIWLLNKFKRDNKNMAGYKMNYFKGMSYDQIKPIFEQAYNKSLVKERFTSAEPTEDIERALWVELKRLYEPDKEDTLWKLQRYMLDPLTWKLYSSCAVHHVSSKRGHDIYMLTEKDYPLTTAVMGLMLSRRLQVEEDSEIARDLVNKIFIEANRSRR
ncbi:hypothetical protein Tco_1439548 [Tanacetum coccineum]